MFLSYLRCFLILNTLVHLQLSLRAAEQRKLIIRTRKNEVANVRFAQRNRDLSARNRELQAVLKIKTEIMKKKFQKEATSSSLMILKKHCVVASFGFRDYGL